MINHFTKLTSSFAICCLLLSACNNSDNKQNQTTMDKEKIKTEVIKAEENLLNLLREGKLMEGVAIHLNSANYRNIWNGEIKTYDILEQRIKAGMAAGLKSFDYQVKQREFMFINDDNVIETLTATETDYMQDGTSATSGVTAISILWQLADNKWRLAYLHASELPKANQ
jgi:hypothetical protein